MSSSDESSSSSSSNNDNGNTELPTVSLTGSDSNDTVGGTLYGEVSLPNNKFLSAKNSIELHKSKILPNNPSLPNVVKDNRGLYSLIGGAHQYGSAARNPSSNNSHILRSLFSPLSSNKTDEDSSNTGYQQQQHHARHTCGSKSSKTVNWAPILSGENLPQQQQKQQKKPQQQQHQQHPPTRHSGHEDMDNPLSSSPRLLSAQEHIRHDDSSSGPLSALSLDTNMHPVNDVDSGNFNEKGPPSPCPKGGGGGAAAAAAAPDDSSGLRVTDDVAVDHPTDNSKPPNNTIERNRSSDFPFGGALLDPSFSTLPLQFQFKAPDFASFPRTTATADDDGEEERRLLLLGRHQDSNFTANALISDHGSKTNFLMRQSSDDGENNINNIGGSEYNTGNCASPTLHQSSISEYTLMSGSYEDRNSFKQPSCLLIPPAENYVYNAQISVNPSRDLLLVENHQQQQQQQQQLLQSYPVVRRDQNTGSEDMTNNTLQAKDNNLDNHNYDTDDDLADPDPQAPSLTLINPKDLPVPDADYVSRLVPEDLHPYIAKKCKKDCRTWLWKSRAQREASLHKQRLEKSHQQDVKK